MELRDLLRTAPLVDGHNDLLWELRELVDGDFDRVDLLKGVPSLHTDLPRLRAGIVGAQFWSVYVPAVAPDMAVRMTLEQIDMCHTMLQRYPRDLRLALTAADVTQAIGEGRIASLIGMEGGHSIGSSLAVLRMMYALGARYLTLTHNHNAPWADSATDVPVHDGLSKLGEQVVREMNRIGMLVDLSHVAPSTMRDALRATGAPVIFSHSSARALCDHPRNVSDDVLQELRINGGVCMVTFVPGFVSQEIAEVWLAHNAEEDRLRAAYPDAPGEVSRHIAAWQQSHPFQPATIAQVADHVDHIREVAGIAHLGIGGDYDGVPFQPAGLEDVSCYPQLFEELRRRSYSDDELLKVAGRNLLRVLRDAEDVANTGTGSP
ncbi:dipeptidase [Streptomyces sp. H34-S4]|uniref:dipeptidase n=1 Tax=Streptomyces sp. H34-S4 TaxID=2996463 RepID=UPI0022706FFF|nr:dipeptidase [Streptomyces sp. H34-S4]MCY0933939.1 dipeptidase [Streptomyces sp. H34-S4]